MNALECILPGGYLDPDGICHRQARVIPLGGREEELLASVESGPHAVSQVLSRCVTHIGHIHPVDIIVARELLVADRQYLLLKLREATFGNRVQGRAWCPWPGCGEEADVNFRLSDIPVRESEQRRPLYEMSLSAAATRADAGRDIVFRLPNGADEEILANCLCTNEAAAFHKLIARCIEGEVELDHWTACAYVEIEAALAAAAPELGLDMRTRCPGCLRDFTLPFELGDFFFGELATSVDLLYREVHYLAYHYHWSEREILDLRRDKRRRYIEILADEMEQLSHAV